MVYRQIWRVWESWGWSSPDRARAKLRGKTCSSFPSVADLVEKLSPAVVRYIHPPPRRWTIPAPISRCRNCRPTFRSATSSRNAQAPEARSGAPARAAHRQFARIGFVVDPSGIIVTNIM